MGTNDNVIMSMDTSEKGRGILFSPAGVASLYTLFAAIWIAGSDWLLTFVGGDVETVMRLGEIKGFAFVAVTGGLLYVLLRSRRLASVEDAVTSLADEDARPHRHTLIAVFVAFSLLLPLLGIGIYRFHGPQAEHEALANLQAIAELKGVQIENWLAERQGDAEVVAADMSLAQLIEQAMLTTDGAAAGLVTAHLERMRLAYGYADIAVFDVAGKPLLALGGAPRSDATLASLRMRAQRQRAIVRGDLYLDASGHARLDWVVPLLAGQDGREVVAVVVLGSAPEHFLFPLIQAWPTASASAESLLVRRDGDDVLFLNQLRQAPGAALTLRRAADSADLPAAVALRVGSGGTVAGHDYRGVAVLAAFRPIFGRDWSLVAKVDRDEVLGPVRTLVFWVSLVGLLALTAIGGLLLRLWRNQQRHYESRLQVRAEDIRQASEQRFRSVANASSDAIVVADREGSIVNWNAAAEHLFGYRRVETIGLSVCMIIPERFRAAHEAGMRRVLAGGPRHVIGRVVEVEARRKDGSQFPVELSLAEWMEDGQPYFAATIRDITERKRAERAIAKQRDLYAMLSGTNQAIVRCSGHDELFHEVCRVAVECGHFRAASIGLIGKQDHHVHIVSRFGEGARAIEHIDISIEAADASGRGPVGEALRSGQYVVSNAFLDDPAAEPWHDAARATGVRAVAAFPLRMNGVVIGPLNLYAGETGYFTEDVLATLTEMATDVSFALANQARDAQLHRTLDLARVMSHVIGASPTVLFRWRAEPHWPVDYVSDNVSRWGYAAAALVSGERTFAELLHPDDADRVLAEANALVAAGETAFSQEYRIVTADGAIRWMDDRTTVTRDASGAPVNFEGVLTDISERKLAEVALRNSEDIKRTVLDSLTACIAVLDGDGGIVSVNAAWSRFAEANGASPLLAHPLGTNYLDACVGVEGEDQATASAAVDGIRDVLARRLPEFSLEYACHSPERKRWFEMRVAPLVGGGPGAVVAHADITERTLAVQSLRDAEARFRSLVEQSIAGIFIIQNGALAYANPRFAEILGYGEPEELLGRDLLSLIVTTDRDRVGERIAMLLRGEAEHLSDEFGGLARDGTVVMLGVNGSLAGYLGAPAIIGMMQDIRDKKAVEDEIRRYVDQLQNAFMQTVEVATTLSELRDPYTAGHERRVAEVAVAIAADLGLDARRQEGLRVAGHLHDIGKIAVPTEILAKPGKLSAAEFEIIKGHVRAGYDVLKSVDFPWPVAEVTLQHHERIDGSGYPQGLQGDAILFEARILAVADTVEAMSSHRPYRPGLGIDRALAEIERGRGRLYDAQVVDACLRLFREQAYVIPD